MCFIMYFSILVGLFYVDYPVLLIMCGSCPYDEIFTLFCCLQTCINVVRNTVVKGGDQSQWKTPDFEHP